MAEYIKCLREEIPYVRPTLILIWMLIRRFFLNIPMAILWVAIWFVECFGFVKAEINMTRKLIVLECRYSALTRNIKVALGQKPKPREGL